MVAIITEKFKLHNAEQFTESFSESSASTYYMFIGNVYAFYYMITFISILLILCIVLIYTIFKYNPH